MKNNTIRWKLTQADIGHLSSVLKPIRTYREVGEMLSLSATSVSRLEASALRKVARAMSSMESSGKHKP